MVSKRYLCSMTFPTCWKNIQNNLEKTDFEINGKIVIWQYTVEFHDELSVYEFLHNKTYQEVGCLVYPTPAMITDCLVYPTPAMITFVDRLETLFCGFFEGIIHMPHVLARLCKCSDDFWAFLKCKEVKCFLWLKSMVRLYMKVQIFHALKRSNVQINQEKMGKCNRKMLKLSYL